MHPCPHPSFLHEIAQRPLDRRVGGVLFRRAGLLRLSGLLGSFALAFGHFKLLVKVRLSGGGRPPANAAAIRPGPSAHSGRGSLGRGGLGRGDGRRRLRTIAHARYEIAPNAICPAMLQAIPLGRGRFKRDQAFRRAGIIFVQLAHLLGRSMLLPANCELRGRQGFRYGRWGNPMASIRGRKADNARSWPASSAALVAASACIRASCS